MTNYLNPEPHDELDMSAMGSLYLAHIGDAVYELMTRSYLCSKSVTSAGRLHRETVRRVCARAQANAAESILPLLTQEEQAVYRRGRNARVHAVPKGASHAQYHAATAVEALFGWLYLRGSHDRLNLLYDTIIKEFTDAT